MKKYSIIFSVILLLLCPFFVCASGIGFLEVHVIDVGQGDAILLRAPSGETMLVDSGNLSAGYHVERYLRDQGISTLGTVVITHMHPDHVGGLFRLVPDMSVKKIYDNGSILDGNDFWEEYINLSKKLGLERKILQKGDTLAFGNVDITVLSPSEPLTGNMNADSLVMKVSYHDVSFMLTGDMNKTSEHHLVGGSIDLKSQVLKVGHHGADDATSEEFLDAVSPSLAVISVGQGNPRGYPGDKTLSLLKKKGVHVYRTDRDGTVIVQTDGTTLFVDLPERHMNETRKIEYGCNIE